ncbi:hypothetical protein HAX54_016312 [Datura stramonium]|uniref:Uncharacterized protein n=1 Tax=Datura stramonium TaxID=4076 RepID=A0ABS8UKV9_DATST|nr:hypothetical protein [Datura stramonium]
MALDVSYIINTFRLLRVLDLGSIYIGQDFPPGIELLIHLRYLAILVDANALPPSLGNLRSLESLRVTPVGQNFEIVQLPSTFWNMAKLRHVHINDCVIYGLCHYEQTFSRRPSKLVNLITLSSAYLLLRQETNDLLRMFPNLQKLRCIFSGSLCSPGSSCQLPRLDLLTRLECLNVSCDNSIKLLYPFELKFPCSLKKLTFSGFQLPWSEISIITELPYLEILKLKFNVFVGEVWDMGDNKFPKLKFLELSILNIVLWNAFDTSFPVLERLVISSYYKLEKIPCSFRDIITLEIIEVKWCKHTLANSVLELKDEQLEYTGYDNLKVHLHHIDPSDEDDTLSCEV